MCALHHKLFDKSVLGITADRRITVSVHYVGRNTTARTQVTALAGHQVTQPQNAFPSIADHHITWHNHEVFRSPARAA